MSDHFSLPPKFMHGMAGGWHGPLNMPGPTLEEERAAGPIEFTGGFPPGEFNGNPVASHNAPLARLISLAAVLDYLRVQAHLAHLNYEAPNFLSVHALLKEQYQLHQEQFDAASEFVRSYDMLMPLTPESLYAESDTDDRPLEAPITYSAVQILSAYLNNLEALVCRAKDLEPVMAENRMIDVQNWLAELIAASAKTAWFLKATLRQAPYDAP